jgi:lyso-ornithine lipid O-acyltransferase
MPAFLRGSYRFLHLVLFLIYGSLLTLRHGSSERGRERLVSIRRRWYRRALEIIGVEVSCRSAPVPGPALVVANHVSWLDIPVLGSVLDVRFLSKAEVARWPLIGLLARRNGTLFIRRGEHHTE